LIICFDSDRFFDTFSEFKSIESSSRAASRRTPPENSNSTFDEECHFYGEWKKLGKDVFVKRTAVFYFTDAKLIHLLLLSRTKMLYDYEISLRIAHEMKEQLSFDLKIGPNAIQVRRLWHFNEYNLTNLTAPFGPSSIFTDKPINDL
jgi:hypothetical protein